MVGRNREIEIPPPDYLNYVMVWVQIKNIPVNHYTRAAISALGEPVKSVDLVAFNPTKPHRHEYVRVRLKLDVTKPYRHEVR
ncbi:hypothetical protein V5N11_014637 [Cardamine amara subsp. amara]|uniref:DUF4283 domain-containing protein n=1 Tax=Cardamine amara subsp. amara TaxID=228776 RepID=A0ABD1ACI7_CARAN